MANQENKNNSEETGGNGKPTASYCDAAVGPGKKIGPYKLLRVLGEGGYGIVYLAERHRPVKRRVALKVIKPGMDTKQVIARFEAERQALALLDHPNIAHVFNAGTTEAGRPYFAMEYVQGDPITEHCDRYKLTIEERLKLFMMVCEAVQYAHQKAIIHRDIKPSNILVAYEGEQAVPMIIDFGVAKALSQSLTERTLVTEQAQMIGTPEYMSPEQAEMTGQDIDTRTDVYSLGTLLYELLTGTLPFDPQTLRDAGIEGMRQMIREQEPKTPSVRFSASEREKAASLAGLRRSDTQTLERRLHGELDWITLKAMDKDRARRYQTAYALAEDIQRYLKKEPVLAGPPSTIYKFRKFAARNKGVFVSVATIAIVVVLAAIISIVLAIIAIDARKVAEKAQDAAEVLAKKQEEDLYFNQIKLAHQELKANKPRHALRLLKKCPEPLRNWEWNYLFGKIHSREINEIDYGADVLSFKFNSDGSILAAFCENGQLVVQDRATGKESSYQIRHNLEQLDRDRERSPWCQWVDFCAAGKYIAVTGDGRTVNLVSIISGRVVQSLAKHTDTVMWMDCSPDGKLLATASSDNMVWLWDLSSGALYWKHPCFKIERVAFSCSGEHLLVDAWEKVIKAYNVEDILSEVEEPQAAVCFTDPSHGIAMTADGRYFATALHDNSILIANGEYTELVRLRGHTGFVTALTFTTDGTRLVSSSIDRTVRLWDAVTGREVLLLEKLEPFNRLVAFGKDDHELVLGNWTDSLTVFDAADMPRISAAPSTILHGHSGPVYTINYSPSGDELVSSGLGSGVRLWNAVDGRQISVVGMSRSCVNADFSTHGQWITAVDMLEEHYVVKVWEASPPHRECFSEVFDVEPCAVTFSVDNRYLIIGTVGVLDVFDLRSRTRVGELGRQGTFITDVTASLDGKYLASTALHGSVKIWDALRVYEPQEGRLVYEGGSPFFWVDFSPDSSRLAVGGREGDIQILDVELGEILLSIPDAHGDIVGCVSFDPSGKYLASCSSDETVRIWDAQTGGVIDIFLEHEGPIGSVAFSPDGKHVASGGYDRTIRIWTPRLE